MKIRRRQITLTVLAVVLLLAGFGAWRFHYQPRRAVAEYKRQLIAAGEKLTIAELIPPPVPLEQDGMDIFLKAVVLLNKPMTLLATNAPPAMRMVAPGKAMVGWRLPEFRDNYSERNFTNTWAEVEAALAEISDALELLRELSEKPRLDFKLNYQQGFSLLLPHLAKTKMATQRLSAAALSDLHRGDTPAAVKNVRAMLALSQGATDERLIISQLVRIAGTAITLNANWELLQSPDLTDGQLATLQRDWSELEFLHATENALAMERAMLELTVGQMRSSSAEFKKMASGFTFGGSGPSGSSGNWFEDAKEFSKETLEKAKMKTKETAWRVAWSHPDQLRALQGDQVLLETLRRVQTNECFDAAFRWQQNRLAVLGYTKGTNSTDSFGDLFDEPDVRTLMSSSVISLAKVSTRVMNIEISRQLVVTAIALKRFHLRHGNYPAELAALTPEFLPAVPRDPVDGQPLRYRANADGTVQLYSIGENAVDDGGDPTSSKTGSASPAAQLGRDWVWPQPASAAEVATYYEELAKKNYSKAQGSLLNALTPEQRAVFEARYGPTSTNAPATNAIP